jgi:hypothetical protein
LNAVWQGSILILTGMKFYLHCRRADVVLLVELD